MQRKERIKGIWIKTVSEKIRIIREKGKNILLHRKKYNSSVMAVDKNRITRKSFQTKVLST